MDSAKRIHRRCQRWPIPTTALLGLLALGAAAYGHFPSDPNAPRRPQQAGQLVDPYVTAEHIAAARVAMITSDSKAANDHIAAMGNDLARAARLPDVTRPIDHEAARAAVRPLAGVRTSLWLDAANFVVMVGDQQHRSMAMIDQVCLALEPLGDTLTVVVNVQDGTAKNPDGAPTLSRNCQLPEGQRAMLQANREVDVVPKETRDRFKEVQAKGAAAIGLKNAIEKSLEPSQ